MAARDKMSINPHLPSAKHACSAGRESPQPRARAFSLIFEAGSARSLGAASAISRHQTCSCPRHEVDGQLTLSSALLSDRDAPAPRSAEHTPARRAAALRAPGADLHADHHFPGARRGGRRGKRRSRRGKDRESPRAAALGADGDGAELQGEVRLAEHRVCFLARFYRKENLLLGRLFVAKGTV